MPTFFPTLHARLVRMAKPTGVRRHVAFVVAGGALCLGLLPTPTPARPTTAAHLIGGAAILLLALLLMGTILSVLQPALRALGRLPGWALSLLPVALLVVVLHRKGQGYLAPFLVEVAKVTP